MINRFRIFLGPRRFRAFFALLGATGLASLLLTVALPPSPTAIALQSLPLAVFLVGASCLILGRLPGEERKRWLAIIVPSALGIIIGSALLPHLSGLFLGAGLGWIVAGIFIFRDIRGPRNYRAAVKAMRKGDYASAINSMTAEIQAKPRRPEHYRFRAELHRLAGDLGSARADYQRMTRLDETSAVAFNGLAEVELQARDYVAARRAAAAARDLAPQEWVAAYNLGMIEDRLRASSAVIEHLTSALELKIPDSRHRLLAHLYLWRAYRQAGADEAAQAALSALQSEKAGLEEWQVIMRAPEAQALRDALSGDIDEARRLLSGDEAHVSK